MKSYATDGIVVLIFPTKETRDRFCKHDPYGFKPISQDAANELIKSGEFIVTDFTQ